MKLEISFVVFMFVIAVLLIGVHVGQIITVVDVYAVCQKEGRYVYASVWFKEKKLTLQCMQQPEQKG